MLFTFLKNQERLQNSLVDTHILCNCKQYSEGSCPFCNKPTEEDIKEEKNLRDSFNFNSDIRESLGKETFDL